MGILVGIGWIIVGILYIIYKIGEEEFHLGKAVGKEGSFFDYPKYIVGQAQESQP